MTTAQTRFLTIGAAVLAYITLAVSPAVALDVVKGTALPANQTAGATVLPVPPPNSNTAVVTRNLNSTTVTVPAGQDAASFEIDTKPLIDLLVQYVNLALGTILPILVAWLVAWVRSRFKVSVSKAESDRLQEAALNAAGLLVARGAVWVEANGKITVESQALASVANTAISKVQDVSKAFHMEPDDVKRLILAKIPQLPTSTPTAAPTESDHAAGVTDVSQLAPPSAAAHV